MDWKRAGIAACLGSLSAVGAAAAGSGGASGPDVRAPGPSLQRTGRVLVKPAARAASRPAGPVLEVIGAIPEVGVLIAAVPAGRVEAEYERELAASGRFEWVMADWLAAPCGGPDDPLYPQQWHLSRLACEQAWKVATGGDVVCAFVDTGVELTHPDLVQRLVPGYNVPDRRPQSAGGRVDDIHGHGTATAGSACGTGNNGVGGCGVAWSLKVMPIRATNSAGGSAFFSDIISGIVWAAQNGGRVINVSYAGVANPVVQDMGAYVRSLGGLLVWAADNTGQDYGPAWDHADVIVVAGTDAGDHKYSLSAYGRGIDLAAPAHDVLVPSRGGGYGLWSGNSFAAPMVAATAGLAWAANPALTPAEVEAILEQACDDIGAPGEDEVFGHGRLNAGRALAMAAGMTWPGSDPAMPGVGTGTGTPYLPAIQPSAQLRLGRGLRSAFYDTPAIVRLPDFLVMTPVEVGIASSISMPGGWGPWPGSTRIDRFAAVFEGYFEAPSRAVYVFTLNSDDGSRLLIDGREVIDHDGVHAMSEKAGTIGLDAGLHTVRIEFFDAEGLHGLISTVRGGGMIRTVLNEEIVRFAADAADFNLDGLVNIQDLLEFLDAYDRQDLRADFNADGLVEFADFLMFIDEYLRTAV